MTEYLTWPEQTLAERIRVLSDMFGGYQKLADKCYISRSSVDKYANGVAEPGYSILVAICNGTGCDANWLLGVDDK